MRGTIAIPDDFSGSDDTPVMVRHPPKFMTRQNSLTPGTTILIDGECNTPVMTAQAAARVPKDNPGKKPSVRPTGKTGKRGMPCVVFEQSLSGFLEDEPDIYSVVDVKVRYR